MNFVGQNLDKMASTLLDCFNSRLIHLYNDAHLIRDLGRLSIVEKSYGYRLQSTRDADGHADRATALAIALLAARDVKVKRRLLVSLGGGSDEPSEPDADESAGRVISLETWRGDLSSALRRAAVV